MKLAVRVQAVQDRREFARWLETKIYEKFGLRPSFAKLAQQAGMTQGTLNSIAKAQRFPTDRTAEKIARLLGMDPLEVKRRAGLVPLYDSEVKSTLTDEELAEVVAAVRRTIETLS